LTNARRFSKNGAVSVAGLLVYPNAEYDYQHNSVPQKSITDVKPVLEGIKFSQLSEGTIRFSMSFPWVATICLKAEAALVVQKPMII